MNKNLIDQLNKLICNVQNKPDLPTYSIVSGYNREAAPVLAIIHYRCLTRRSLPSIMSRRSFTYRSTSGRVSLSVRSEVGRLTSGRETCWVDPRLWSDIRSIPEWCIPCRVGRSRSHCHSSRYTEGRGWRVWSWLHRSHCRVLLVKLRSCPWWCWGYVIYWLRTENHSNKYVITVIEDLATEWKTTVSICCYCHFLEQKQTTPHYIRDLSGTTTNSKLLVKVISLPWGLLHMLIEFLSFSFEQ